MNIGEEEDFDELEDDLLEDDFHIKEEPYESFEERPPSHFPRPKSLSREPTPRGMLSSNSEVVNHRGEIQTEPTIMGPNIDDCQRRSQTPRTLPLSSHKHFLAQAMSYSDSQSPISREGSLPPSVRAPVVLKKRFLQAEPAETQGPLDRL